MDKIRVELKLWENEFIQLNGRFPEKHDIKKNPEIKRKYKEYAQFKKMSIDSSCISGKQIPNTPKKMSILDNKVELILGPTPQIYGKVISLLEINISPLNKSPGLISHSKEITTIISKVPVKRQLNFSITPLSSPVKNPVLNKPILRPNSEKYYGPNSPVKFDKEISISLSQRTPRTIDRSENITSYTPSPLIKLPQKTLSQLAIEHEQILNEFNSMVDETKEHSGVARKLANILEEEDKENIENGDEKKHITYSTHKKSKKRKIVRLETDETRHTTQKISNVHEEIKKLKQKELDIFNGVYDNEQMIEKTVSTINTTSKIRKSKFNIVSNNFRRLKVPKKGHGLRRKYR